MATFFKKVWAWIVAHKAISIAIASGFVVCLTLAIALPLSLSNNDNNPQQEEQEEIVTKLSAEASFESTYNPEKTYDGEMVIAPTLSDYTTTSDGNVTFEWFVKDGDTYSTEPLATAPTDAGTYKLVMTVAETETYQKATVEKEFTIAKRKLTNLLFNTYYSKRDTATYYVNEIEKGVVSGEEVKILVTYTSKNAGATIKEFAFENEAGKNYYIDETSATGQILRTQIVAFTINKVYDKTNTISKIIQTPLGSSFNATIIMSSANVGATVSDIQIEGEDNLDNFETNILSRITASITPKELIFDEQEITKVYDGTAYYTHSFTEADGLIAGDSCTLTFKVTDQLGGTYINAGTHNDIVAEAEVVSNSNYTVNTTPSNIFGDGQGTEIIITKKVISGLELETTSNAATQNFTLTTADGIIDGNTVKVEITANSSADYDNETTLTLTTDVPAQGIAQIKLLEEGDYENYEIASSNIGTITKVS
ncbi:MAG: hypothetical protein ACI4L1_00235 [Christensenellales bacterium]